jgi:hypothetical protein
MRMLLAVAILLCAGLILTTTNAGEKPAGKEVTIKGKITCAKCDLGVEKKCMTVIVTKKDGKDVTIYLDKDGDSKNHAAICSSPKDGSITGVITDDGKKKTIKVKTLKFDS